MSIIGTLNIPDINEWVNTIGYNGILSDNHKSAIISTAKEKYIDVMFLEGNNDTKSNDKNTFIISSKNE